MEQKKTEEKSLKSKKEKKNFLQIKLIELILRKNEVY